MNRVRGNTLENRLREDIDIPHQEMVRKNNRRNSQEGSAESSDDMSSNQSQGSMIAEGVQIMNDVFLRHGKSRTEVRVVLNRGATNRNRNEHLISHCGYRTCSPNFMQQIKY